MENTREQWQDVEDKSSEKPQKQVTGGYEEKEHSQQGWMGW